MCYPSYTSQETDDNKLKFTYKPERRKKKK